MRILRTTIICVVFFFLKESLIAKQDYSFKNDLRNSQDSSENINSTRRAKSRQFWKEFWEDYAPAVAVGGGVHSGLYQDGNRIFGIGPAWNAVLDFPFDKEHHINLEFSYHMMYSTDSLGQLMKTSGASVAGMRFYFTERNTRFRPFGSWSIGAVAYIFPLLNIAAGTDYTITPDWAVSFSIHRMHSFNKSPFTTSTYGSYGVRYTSYAGFLGMRYQF